MNTEGSRKATSPVCRHKQHDKKFKYRHSDLIRWADFLVSGRTLFKNFSYG